MLLLPDIQRQHFLYPVLLKIIEDIEKRERAKFHEQFMKKYDESLRTISYPMDFYYYQMEHRDDKK